MVASSLAWVLGPVGATAMAGVVIASATVAEEVIVAAAARRLATAVMRAAAVQHDQTAVDRFASTQWPLIRAVRVPVQVMHQLRVAADVPAAADIQAAAVDIGNL